MTRADLLVGPQTDTGNRMSFKEKKKKIHPDGMMKGMISQLAWQRQGHHNLPTRWSEPQGKSEFHCSTHFGTGRSGMGWRRGCLPNGHSWPRAWILPQICFSALTISGEREGDCHPPSFEFCLPTSSMAVEEWPERWQNKRTVDTLLRVEQREKMVLWVSVRVPIYALSSSFLGTPTSSDKCASGLLSLTCFLWSSATGGVELGPSHVSCIIFKATCFPNQERQRFKGLLSHKDAVMDTVSGRCFSSTEQGSGC